MDSAQPARKPKSWWTALLLVPPYLGLCFPALYVRSDPAVLGFPFFYWYQFAWVVLTSLLLFVYYRLTSRGSPPVHRAPAPHV